MNIQELQQKIKYHTSEYITDELYIVAIIILVGIASFGLGRLSIVREHKIPVRIEYPEQIAANVLSTTDNIQGETEITQGGRIDQSFAGALVGSKNGSKYHFPWCSGAQRTKEKNKIWFASKEEAERAGYTPAANCKGL